MTQHIKNIKSNTKQESPRVGVEPAIPVFKVEAYPVRHNSLGLLGINSVPISNIYTYTLLQT